METVAMGLLNNNFPDDLLELIRNAAQNRSQSANSGAGSANDLPSWVPRQQQRLPLSFAGPVLTPDINASSPSPPRAPFALPGPADADTGLSWLRGDRSNDPPRARPPTPPAQNLTAQALRMKGVPEADIAAAAGNPELMKQLIIRNFSLGSAGAPTRTGYAPDGSSANGGSFGDSYAYVRSAPTLNVDSRGTAIAEPYSPKQNSNQSQQAGITSDKSSYCRTMRNICIRECEGILGGPDAFGPFRACMRTCMHNAGCFDF
jgi:hypothetical protein